MNTLYFFMNSLDTSRALLFLFFLREAGEVGFGAQHQILGATACLPNPGCKRVAHSATLCHLSPERPTLKQGTGNNARVTGHS